MVESQAYVSKFHRRGRGPEQWWTSEVTGDRDCPFFGPCHVYPDRTAGSSPLDNDNDNNGIAVLPVAQCAAT